MDAGLALFPLMLVETRVRGRVLGRRPCPTESWFCLWPCQLSGRLLSPSARGVVTTALGRGEVVWAPDLAGSAAVWGRGLGSTHGLEKSKMAKSGLCPWVSKHASWVFFFTNNLTKKTTGLGFVQQVGTPHVWGQGVAVSKGADFKYFLGVRSAWLGLAP